MSHTQVNNDDYKSYWDELSDDNVSEQESKSLTNTSIDMSKIIDNDSDSSDILSPDNCDIENWWDEAIGLIENNTKSIEEVDDIIEYLQNYKQKYNKIEDEPLLKIENRRFTVYPIKYPRIFDMYKKQLSCFWKVEEIDFSTDKEDFKELNENEQHFLKMILAFFAASDGIVNFNLSDRFLKDIQIMEGQIAYIFQMMMENIHGEVYSLMLDNLIDDVEERDRLFKAIETVPSVKKMADWAFKWINSSKSFAYRVIAFAIVEGVFFSGAFAAIFWFKKYKNKGKMFLKGLIKSNEFIARDEGLHTEFACELYSNLKHKLPKKEIYDIMDGGVKVSQNFMEEALPLDLLGMSSGSMNNYIEYIGDRLLVSLGYSKKYNKENPFKFMETIGLPGKTNFFEMRPTEYQDAHVFNKDSSSNYFDLDDSF